MYRILKNFILHIFENLGLLVYTHGLICLVLCVFGNEGMPLFV